MRHLGVYLLASFLFINCSGKNKVVVDLNSETPKFTDLFEGVEFIPLESGEEAKMIRSGRYAYAFGRDVVAILDVFSDYSVRLFDYEGHFLKRVSNQGGGHGYYSLAYDILIDDDLGFLVVLDPTGKLLRYSLSEECAFVDELCFKNQIKAGHHIVRLSDNRYVVYSITDTNHLFICSFNDNTITPIEYSIPAWLTSSPFLASVTPLYYYNKGAFICDGLNGHIWEIAEEGMLSHVEWDFGAYNLDINDIPDSRNPRYYSQLFQKSSYLYATQFSFAQENDKYIIMLFFFRNMEHILMYDKTKNRTMVFHTTSDGIRVAIGYCQNQFMYRIVRPDFTNQFNNNDCVGTVYNNHVLLKYTFK